MRYFKSLVKTEFFSYYSKNNFLILLILLLILMMSISAGYIEYQNSRDYSKNSQITEQLNQRARSNFVLYSMTGVKVIYFSSPMMVFFSNHYSIGNMKGWVNSVGDLEIKNDRKGELFLSIDSLFTFRFANILYIFFSLVSLFLGYNSIYDREYLKFIASVATRNAIFFTRIGVGISILSISLLFAYSWCVGYSLILGLKSGDIDFPKLLCHAFLGILMISLFFISGTFIGSIRIKIGNYAVLMLWWLCLSILIPNLLHSLTIEKSLNLSSAVELYAKKMEVFKEFEEGTEKKYGKFNKENMKQERMIIEGFLDNEFKELLALEEKHRSDIIPIYKFHNNISLLFPVSYYNLTSNEVSSRGLRNFLAFYSYLIELWQKFSRFYIDGIFYREVKTPEYFPKGDKDLFKAKSMLPENFGWGIMVNFGWIFILGGISFFLFKRSFYKLDKAECHDIGTAAVEFKKDEINVYHVENESFKNFLFTLFSGYLQRFKNCTISGEVKYDGVNFLQEKNRTNFLYLCKPNDVPGNVRVKDLLNIAISISGFSKAETQAFFAKPELAGVIGKRFKQLTKEEKLRAMLLLTQVIKRDIYLIHDVAPRRPSNCLIVLKDQLDVLKEESLVIYLNSNPIQVIPDLDDESVYQCDGSWALTVEALKNKYRRKAQKNSVENGID